MKQLEEQAPPTLSPAVFQLAESNHLGALQEVYTLPKSRSRPGDVAGIVAGVTFVLVGMFTFWLIFVLAAFIPAGEATLIYFVALVLLTIIVFWKVFRKIARGKDQICLYSAGLVWTRNSLWTRGSPTKALRWEQIETLRRGILQSDPSGVGDLDRIAISGPEGITFYMHMLLFLPAKDRAFLCDTIEREFVNARLPETIQQFNSGSPVIFRSIPRLPGGALSISQEGLNNGEETLAWNQVQSFIVDDTQVLITKEGRTSPWLSYYVPEFPNACLLKALARQASLPRQG